MKFLRCKACQNTLFLKENNNDVNCCGMPMEELTPGVSDGAEEKHIPVLQQDGNRVLVQVGSVEHPMLDIHYIEWIGLESQNGFQIKWLHPNEEPKAEFVLTGNEQVISVYEYCNIHGLWKK